MAQLEPDREANDSGLVLLTEAMQQNLLPAVIRQLNKDFQLTGVDFSMSEKTMPESVVQGLKQRLESLVQTDFQRFLNLLYRADIPESKIRRSQTRGIDEFIHDASYELLKREWQKVWLRNKIQ